MTDPTDRPVDGRTPVDGSGPPFRADHVGSLLRPERLLRARAEHAAGRLDAAGLRAVEDEAVADAVGMQRDAGHDDDRSGGFEPLRFVPPGKRVVLGLVTTKRPELERKDDLERRIDEAARSVPLERLCLSPQWGFFSTVVGNALTVDDQRAELDLVVQTAEEVWG